VRGSGISWTPVSLLRLRHSEQWAWLFGDLTKYNMHANSSVHKKLHPEGLRSTGVFANVGAVCVALFS